MNDFPNSVPDDGNLDASQDTQGFQGGQTQQDGEAEVDVIAELRQTRQEIAQLREHNTRLERQIQSQGDKVFARLSKRMQEDEAAIRRTAEIDGADEKSTLEKIRKARERVLLSMPLNELEDLNSQQRPPQAQAGESVSTLQAHAAQLVQYLNSLGLSESDLGQTGVAPFAGKAPGSPEHKQFARLVAKALDAREQAAQQYALHMQRQGVADEMADELAQTGGLGGTTGNRLQGAGAARANALRLIQQEKAKYKGTGRGGDWLSRKEQLLEQYGLPSDTVV